MSKEIIINVTGGQSRIAIVEDGELVELYIENPENVRTIGDIYLGRVRRILPGIKAAFVDIGQKQDAFLHFSDLSDNIPALLELSEGKVPDWSTKSLPKAPKQDDDKPADLELETPEEQRAAKRRRDLKRTHGKNRRGRGRKNEEASETTSKQAAAEPQAEQKEQAAENSEAKRRDRSDSRSQRDRRGRGQSRREQAVPQPPESEVVPDTAPEILPPDAVAEPPSRDDAPTSKSQADTQPSSDDKPKRRRGRRGGRGRNRSRRQTVQPTNEQQPEQPDTEAQSADTETTEQPKAEASSNASRSRRGRSRRSESSDAKPNAEANGADRRDETPQPSPEASSEQPKAEQPKSEQSKPERKQKPKAERPEPKPEVVDASAAASSRFVIDLTSKTGRVGRVEEEEEEEERSSRSRGGRRRGGRRRGRSRSGGSSNNGSGGGNSQDGKSRNSRSSNRGRSQSNGSSNRSGSSDRGSSNGSDSNVRPETHLKQDQKLIVKITKEPISSKGPRVSTDVSLAGRFLVLIPQADYVAVSKKIESSKERRRLRALARSLLPESFGLIVRTVAENRDAKALNTDLRLLLDKWKKIEDQLKEKPKPPKELHQDVNMVSSIIRDLFSDDYDRIVVDDPAVHRNIKSYVQAVAPQMAPLVKLHKGKEHVFRTYKIDRDVRAAFESRVSLPGGGYLFIEHTEAMHVVDVNSGRAGKGLSQEENALRVNLESARAIAKQLRLRDLGGIICVDFIDMRSDSARRKLYDELKKEFRKDRAVTKLLPMSDFGVIQITRQRLRPSITTTTDVDDLPAPLPESEEPRRAERESVAEGETLTASEVVAKLEQWLATYRAEVQEQHRKRPILIRVHPFLAAYLQRGVPSAITRWRFRTWLKFRLDVDDSADPLSFSVRDEKSGKNLTRKYDPDLRETA